MIVIGNLHVGMVSPEWIINWEELNKPLKPDGKPDWVTYSVTRQIVHQARNDIVKAMLQNHPEATHLFFIDDDICVPSDGLLRLLSHNLPVVTGFCIQRATPFMPTVFHKRGDDKLVVATKFCDGLQEVDACGGGCLLIRADVLRAIEETGEPWFDWPASGLSEDLAFCERVKRLGYPIVLDFDVRCTHLGTLYANYEMFEQIYHGEFKFETEEMARVSQTVRPYGYAEEVLHV